MAKATSGRSKKSKNEVLPVMDVEDVMTDIPETVEAEFEDGGGENG